MASVNQIKDTDFKNDVINSKTPVMIDFYADWCGPCKLIAPDIEVLSKEYREKMKFYKMDVEKNPTTANAYGVMSIPTVLIFKNGKAVHQFTGLTSKVEMEKAIKKFI